MTEWEELIEQLAEEESNDLNALIEDLTEWQAHPLNINTASRDVLQRLLFSETLADQILSYIERNGELKTLHELLLIKDMDTQTIDRIRPFVCVRPVERGRKKLFAHGRHETVARLDIPFYRRNGYNTVYTGTPIYQSLRYRFHTDRLETGVTAEKDAGEPWGALHNRTGYDSYAFYAVIKDTGILQTLAIGDYRINWGHGLVISQDFLMGKGTSLSASRHKPNTIRKHASTDEYNYLSGVAAAVAWKHITLTAFYSNRRLDAISTPEKITSIQKTGLHRTQTEAERRKTARLQAAGVNASLTWRRQLTIGVSGLYYFFDRPYVPSLREYARYNLQGNYFHNIGTDYRYRLHRLELSGESAWGKYGFATLHTLSFQPSDDYRLQCTYRSYSHDYWAWFARSFSEGGYVQNENGWYFAAECSPIRHWKFFASADFFRFPWLKYQIDRPSKGTEITIKATYAPHRRWNMWLRFRMEQKEKNYTESKQKSVRSIRHQNARYRLTVQATRSVTLRTTLDYTQVHIAGVTPYHGFQAGQAIAYASDAFPVQIQLQSGYFRTDNYDTRVYTFERGLLYTYNSLSHYGNGLRSWAYARWNYSDKVTLTMKFGHTLYFDRDAIGSSTDKIEGRTKQDLQLQARWKF
jgi:hypothetical protein